MDLYQSFENAIKAEKNAGIGFMLLGVLFWTIFIYLFVFANRNNFLIGAKLPSLIAGLLMIIGGFFYISRINKNFEIQTDLYQKDKTEFVKSEKRRSEKLFNGYSKYRSIYLLSVLIALVFMFAFKQSLINGIGFVLFLFSIYTIFSETYSSKHTDKYLKELSAWEK